MNKKVISYIGLARRARKLVAGYNTSIFSIKKRQAKLILLCQGISENTESKLRNLCRKNNIPLRIYGTAEELSKAAGVENRGVFAVIDQNFANVIKKEIDND